VTAAPCRGAGRAGGYDDEEDDLSDPPPLPERESLTEEQITLAKTVRSLGAEIDRHQAQISLLARRRAVAIEALHRSGLSIRRVARVVGTSPGPIETALARVRRPATDPHDAENGEQ
jgi:DNA-directed RNA polymerase specialized sigma24 family protein